ncbi:putative reverse transcriptase domain-containing protein, partial [Tanacetum coccineum]
MTPESIQAMIDQALLRNSTNGDGRHSSYEDNRRNIQTTCLCFYANFMKCQPLNFKGNEGVVCLTRWIKKMESVFNISGCAIENQEVLKKKMTDKYYPQGEIKKLEIELWNLKVKGNDVPTYTERFQELTLICTKFAANEIEKVDKYISGLPDNIYGNVKSSKPKILDETIELANDLMDQKLRTIGKANWQQKEADDPSKLTMAINKQPSRDRSRQGATIMYGVRRKEAYGGSLLKCTKCAFSINNGSCTQKSQKYKKRANRAVPKREWFVLNVEAPRTLSKDCPKLKNKDGNGNRHKAGYTQLEMQRTECNNGRESRLTIISCSKAQEYMARGCQIFLAQIIRQKEDDQSEGKQLKDGTRSFGFFEVVSRGLACLPPARPLNSRSDLIPGSAPVMLLRCHGHQSCNCLTKFLSLEALFEGRHIKRGRDTKIPQSSGPPDKGSGPRCQDTILGVVDAQTRFEIPSKQSIDPPLSRGYTLGSGEDKSDGFAEIIDFLKASSVHYALTVNPIIYTSCIEQFWATAKVQTVNGVRQLQALVDKKRVIITESSIRKDLHLDDAEGTDCLPTATIFEELARMGYEKPSQKLTFYKAFFSPQWKYFIHTITQCLSAKSTTWNEFSSSMASLIICLATNQKFNLSKYIFDAMVKHLDGGVKFLLGEDSMQLTNLMVLCTKLQTRVLDLQKVKDAQAKEIAALKKRIQSLGAPEDASKQGRSIEDIDANVDVPLVDETQERKDDDLMYETRVLEDDELHVEAKVDEKEEQSTKLDDSTASEAVTTASVDDSVVPTTIKEITLAQTLIQIKAAKPKVVTIAATTTTIRPKDRGVVVQEPSE